MGKNTCYIYKSQGFIQAFKAGEFESPLIKNLMTVFPHCYTQTERSIQPFHSSSFQLLLYVEVDVSQSGKLTLLLIFTNPIH